MTVQKIPLEAVQKIRQHIKTVLVLPESENRPRSSWDLTTEEELPEPNSLNELGSLFNFGGSAPEESHVPNRQGQWFISSTNPGAVLLKLPGLKLKPELRLITYLHRVAEDGIGATWAVPEHLSTTAQLEKALSVSGDRQQPPQPNGALAHVMDAVDGDHSPASYLVASILQRELKEFGALGKSCDWTHHRLIAAIPAQANWQWRIDVPKDLSPKVRLLPDGRAALEFFTCRVVAPIAIFQHIDQYPTGQYKAAYLDRPVAVAQKA